MAGVPPGTWPHSWPRTSGFPTLICILGCDDPHVPFEIGGIGIPPGARIFEKRIHRFFGKEAEAEEGPPGD